MYKEARQPVIGDLLPVPNNRHDRQAVAIYLDGVVVGHVPRALVIECLRFGQE